MKKKLKINWPQTFSVALYPVGSLALTALYLTWYGFTQPFSWTPIILTLTVFPASLILINFGIAIGNHRAWTHKAVKLHESVEWVLVALSGWAMQGEICSWVRSHLSHHSHCEEKGKDPHTPRDGILHAWFGWLVWGPEFRVEPLKSHQQSRPLMWQHKGNNYLWLTLFMNFVMPALLALALWSTGLIGPWHHMIWVYLLCTLARTYQFHATILGVNVLAHMWGKKKYLTHASKNDDSTDNLFAALSTTGEGFHNWHHSWPWAATHAPVKGLHNRLVDLSGSVILVLEKLGLAWDVKMPTPEQIERARHAAKLAAQNMAEDAAEAAQLALEASVGLKRAKVKAEAKSE